MGMGARCVLGGGNKLILDIYYFEKFENSIIMKNCLNNSKIRSVFWENLFEEKHMA
jgi:hypothetical protein